MKDGWDIWPIFDWHAFKRERERVPFILWVFLRKHGSIRFAWQYNDFDGHSMVSKMVIEFFLGFTTMKLGEFIYRLAFHATYVAVAGLRVNWLMGYRDAYWYIKNTWIGFSVRNIAKQALACCTFITAWVLVCLK